MTVHLAARVLAGDAGGLCFVEERPMVDEPAPVGMPPDQAGLSAAVLATPAAVGEVRRLPLSRSTCLALSRAVLSADESDWASATSDPVVASWCMGVCPDTVQPWRTAPGRRALLRRLHGAVIAGPPAGPEAAVLLAAVAAALRQGDVAERFEQAVAEARREALREFAYGAGHEINNPLANIAARAQALLADEQDPERRRRLATIVDQAYRARDMIGGLMVFARPPRPQPAAVDLDGLVRAVLDPLAAVARARNLRLEYSPAPVPVVVDVDARQVQEALRVIIMNAFEAVDEGGRVEIACVRPSGGPAGRCLLTVGDDGPGMDADAARRAFDPFYSGRDAGRGIGLGLPKAWRLIEGSGGEVSIESRPGQGTRVTIAFPEHTI
jgi:hypothetical protein